MPFIDLSNGFQSFIAKGTVSKNNGTYAVSNINPGFYSLYGYPSSGNTANDPPYIISTFMITSNQLQNGNGNLYVNAGCNYSTSNTTLTISNSSTNCDMYFSLTCLSLVSDMTS